MALIAMKCANGRRIALGSDHAGAELKGYLIARLQDEGYECVDLGVSSTEPADYPDISHRVAEAVATGRCAFGIVICGTGIGSCIAANKLPGVRCALCWNEYTARMSRAHNNANVLALGARIFAPEFAWSIVQVWLSTPFSNEERHVRRINKIAALERAGSLG